MTSQLLPERMERDESSGSAIKCSSSEENPKRKVRSRTRSRSCTLVRASRKEKNVIGAPQSPKSSPLKTSRQDVSLAHMSAPKAGTTVEEFHSAEGRHIPCLVELHERVVLLAVDDLEGERVEYRE